MINIRIFQDTTININLAAIINGLNLLCKNISFSVGKKELVIADFFISYPDTYSRISPEIINETKNDFLTIFITKKQYDNNYFFKYRGRLIILSLYSWETLSILPESNGLIFFLAEFLALEIDDTYRHDNYLEQPKPECIYDFKNHKPNVDIGMRSALICPSCMERINKSQMTERQIKIFEDLKKVLNDLGNASKWETDIIEFWNNKKDEVKNIQTGENTNMRNQVFISYSHADSEWLRKLKVHLRPFERNYHIHIWDDTKIKTGTDWKEEIKRALEKTKVAVLLVSADFLASDFIELDELPPLLEAVKNDGAIIMPIILRPCGFTRFPKISRFQAVNSPSKTLVEMNEGEQERFLLKLTEDILNNLP